MFIMLQENKQKKFPAAIGQDMTTWR